MNKKFTFSTVILLFTLLSSYGQKLHIQIEENQFHIDTTHNIIVSRFQNVSDPTGAASYDTAEITLNEERYTFKNVPDTLSTADSYEVVKAGKSFTLYFTQLPLISINSSVTIVDEPKVATDLVYADDEQVFTSICGVEYRGGFSQTFPKKSLDLEFWEDAESEESRKVQLSGLRKDDDWVLDAIYNEPLRLRAYVSHKLWVDMHTLYYAEKEPEAVPGARVRYAELFLNGKYHGIYMLSEQVDRKQLKLKKYDDDNDQVRGVLYKGDNWGATKFTSLPPIDNSIDTWGGHEQKHPDEDDYIDWGYLYNFTDFVMNAPDDQFDAGIWEQFDKNNLMDYFIFLNLTFAADNTGKNIYLGKYDTDSPYFYTPWDLDGTFGWRWDGTKFDVTDYILTNGLFKRIIAQNPDNVNFDMAEKWSEYREGIFSTDSLKARITNAHTILTSNNIYERESIVFGNYPFDKAALDYTTDWLDRRLDYLDGYFENLLSLEPKIEKNKSLTLYPNPTNGDIYLQTNGRTTMQGSSYIIVDMAGRLIKKGELHEPAKIGIHDLKQGVYLLKINNGTYKILKR